MPAKPLAWVLSAAAGWESRRVSLQRIAAEPQAPPIYLGGAFFVCAFNIMINIKYIGFPYRSAAADVFRFSERVPL
jgi:hypothetical protein